MNNAPTPRQTDPPAISGECLAIALEFLESRINFERSPPTAHVELGGKLDTMRCLLGRLDDPQRRYATVHIAGTKGKGSVCEMIERMLRAAGYRTGRFTSPHLYSFTERIAINGAPCTSERCAETLLFLKERFASDPGAVTDIASLTYFELLTLLAFLFFAEEKVDVAIFEVGLGGRFDATNLCEPTVCAITSIGFDHTELLGETLELIATEKAGIVKPGVPVVSGVRQQSPRDTIRRIAAERGVSLSEINRDFRLIAGSGSATYCESTPTGDTKDAELTGIRLGMHGEHQMRNAAVAVRTVRLLNDRGFSVSGDAVRTGLANAKSPLRIEQVCNDPVLILDGAHNQTSAEALIETLRVIPIPGRRFLLFGAMIGKDIESMLAVLLPHFDEALFTRCTTNPRAFPAIGLATIASAVRGRRHESLPLVECFPETVERLPDEIPSMDLLETRAIDDPGEAFRLLWDCARSGDLICVTGSLYLAAEIRRIYFEMEARLPKPG